MLCLNNSNTERYLKTKSEEETLRSELPGREPRRGPFLVHIGGMKTLEDSSTREVVAIKRQISRSLRSRLKQRGATMASLARDTGTSRAAIRRVLDDQNTSITLHTIVRTAKSLAFQVRLTMEPTIEKVERVATPQAVEPLMRKLGRALDRLPAR